VIIELLLMYVVYLLLLIIGSYYVNLYLSKDQFTKEELKEVLPYLSQLLSKIINNYSTSILIATLLVSSIIGIALPLISDHWFLNSSIIFLIMFFTFPVAKKNFDKTQVTTGGTASDTVINIFSRYYNVILIGFGNGSATGLMYNWGVYKSVHFLWFLINFIALSVMVGVAIKNFYDQ
jgi:hypothetical protein